MKNYKDFEKMYIGASDGACLTISNCDKEGNSREEMLYFGEDGEYSAYITYGDVEIGDHYKLMHEFHGVITIFDDVDAIFTAKADTIKVYQAGEFGCIIHLEGNDIHFARIDIKEAYKVVEGEAVPVE